MSPTIDELRARYGSKPGGSSELESGEKIEFQVLPYPLVRPQRASCECGNRAEYVTDIGYAYWDYAVGDDEDFVPWSEISDQARYLPIKFRCAYCRKAYSIDLIWMPPELRQVDTDVDDDVELIGRIMFARSELRYILEPHWRCSDCGHGSFELLYLRYDETDPVDDEYLILEYRCDKCGFWHEADMKLSTDLNQLSRALQTLASALFHDGPSTRDLSGA